MARASKQGQQAFEFKTWGGKRKGAGRPAKATRPSEPHKRRERFTQPTALHVTLRVIDGVGKLRRRAIYQAVGRAVISVLPRADFRIVHLSLETDHVHVICICEADNDGALTSGIRRGQETGRQAEAAEAPRIALESLGLVHIRAGSPARRGSAGYFVPASYFVTAGFFAGAGAIRSLKNAAGSTDPPGTRTLRCRCGPVARPV